MFLISNMKTINQNYSLLLLSNSTNPGHPFLAWPEETLSTFLHGLKGYIAFVPYAAVTLSWDSYTEKVRERMQTLGYSVKSVHTADDPAQMILNASAIMIGGGNTFQLIHLLHEHSLLDAIRKCVNSGTPYIGWSAGSNVACPTIQTTNDMPVLPIRDFSALGLIPFQINPHFTDKTIPNHGSETRSQRIKEYLAVNKELPVLGLREGTGLVIKNGEVMLVGDKPAEYFKSESDAKALKPGRLNV